MLNRMHTRLAQLREERAEGDKGFTLIELLVVVVIIGILIAIAIPLYLHFENGAKNNSAQSDTHSAVAVVQQCANDNNGTLPASVASASAGADVTLACGGTNTETITVSPNNTLTYTNAGGGNFTVATLNGDTNNTYTYDSTTGKITQS